MASRRAQYAAARHIGQGSQLVYSSQPVRAKAPRARAAARIAFTSACAVGSLVAVTELAPSPTISPWRTTTAPNGPPLPRTTFSVASSMARRRNSGFGLPGMTALSSCAGIVRQHQYGTAKPERLRTVAGQFAGYGFESAHRSGKKLPGVRPGGNTVSN